MNDTQIKPAVVDHTVAAHVACESHGDRYGIDWIWHHDGIGLLHPQSAIDRLMAARNAMRIDNARLDEICHRLESERDAALESLDRYWGEREAAVAALDRIVSLKMSMFKDPCDMLGECVNIAARAIDAARAQNKENSND